MYTYYYMHTVLVLFRRGLSPQPSLPCPPSPNYTTGPTTYFGHHRHCEQHACSTEWGTTWTFPTLKVKNISISLYVMCVQGTSSRTKVVKSMGQSLGKRCKIQDELLTPHAQQRRSLLLHGQRHRVLASRENRPRERVVVVVVVVVAVVVVEVVVAAVVVVAAAVAVVAVVTWGWLGHRRVP